MQSGVLGQVKPLPHDSLKHMSTLIQNKYFTDVANNFSTNAELSKLQIDCTAALFKFFGQDIRQAYQNYDSLSFDTIFPEVSLFLGCTFLSGTITGVTERPCGLGLKLVQFEHISALYSQQGDVKLYIKFQMIHSPIATATYQSSEEGTTPVHSKFMKSCSLSNYSQTLRFNNDLQKLFEQPEDSFTDSTFDAFYREISKNIASLHISSQKGTINLILSQAMASKPSYVLASAIHRLRLDENRLLQSTSSADCIRLISYIEQENAASQFLFQVPQNGQALQRLYRTFQNTIDFSKSVKVNIQGEDKTLFAVMMICPKSLRLLSQSGLCKVGNVKYDISVQQVNLTKEDFQAAALSGVIQKPFDYDAREMREVSSHTETKVIECPYMETGSGVILLDNIGDVYCQEKLTPCPLYTFLKFHTASIICCVTKELRGLAASYFTNVTSTTLLDYNDQLSFEITLEEAMKKTFLAPGLYDMNLMERAIKRLASLNGWQKFPAEEGRTPFVNIFQDKFTFDKLYDPSLPNLSHLFNPLKYSVHCRSWGKSYIEFLKVTNFKEFAYERTPFATIYVRPQQAVANANVAGCMSATDVTDDHLLSRVENDSVDEVKVRCTLFLGNRCCATYQALDDITINSASLLSEICKGLHFAGENGPSFMAEPSFSVYEENLLKLKESINYEQVPLFMFKILLMLMCCYNTPKEILSDAERCYRLPDDDIAKKRSVAYNAMETGFCYFRQTGRIPYVTHYGCLRAFADYCERVHNTGSVAAIMNTLECLVKGIEDVICLRGAYICNMDKNELIRMVWGAIDTESPVPTPMLGLGSNLQGHPRHFSNSIYSLENNDEMEYGFVRYHSDAVKALHTPESIASKHHIKMSHAYFKLFLAPLSGGKLVSISPQHNVFNDWPQDQFLNFFQSLPDMTPEKLNTLANNIQRLITFGDENFAIPDDTLMNFGRKLLMQTYCTESHVSDPVLRLEECFMPCGLLVHGSTAANMRDIFTCVAFHPFASNGRVASALGFEARELDSDLLSPAAVASINGQMRSSRDICYPDIRYYSELSHSILPNFMYRISTISAIHPQRIVNEIMAQAINYLKISPYTFGTIGSHVCTGNSFMCVRPACLKTESAVLQQGEGDVFFFGSHSTKINFTSQYTAFTVNESKSVLDANVTSSGLVIPNVALNSLEYGLNRDVLNYVQLSKSCKYKERNLGPLMESLGYTQYLENRKRDAHGSLVNQNCEIYSAQLVGRIFTTHAILIPIPSCAPFEQLIKCMSATGRSMLDAGCNQRSYDQDIFDHSIADRSSPIADISTLNCYASQQYSLGSLMYGDSEQITASKTNFCHILFSVPSPLDGTHQRGEASMRNFIQNRTSDINRFNRYYKEDTPAENFHGVVTTVDDRSKSRLVYRDFFFSDHAVRNEYMQLLKKPDLFTKPGGAKFVVSPDSPVSAFALSENGIRNASFY